VSVLGPMLATTVGSAPATRYPSSFRNRGLSARPAARCVTAIDRSPFQGNWLLSLSIPREGDGVALKAARALSTAVDLAHGVTDPNHQVGLEMALTGAVTEGLRTAHEVSDWVVIADPLFSIELLDQAKAASDAAVLLDFSPEFDPYPGGRIVVTTRYLREVEALGSAVAEALSSTGSWTAILASISARRLLALANPTKQVVHELAGLALSRVLLAADCPRALVVPIDGHEDMFVFPRLGRGQILADLLSVQIVDSKLILEVVESKWTTRANLESTVKHGVDQASVTAEVIRAAYVDYEGVDREMRLDNLREVISFHAARARRHGVPSALSEDQFRSILESDDSFRGADVLATVLAWCPDGSFGSSATEDRNGVRVRYLDGEGIRRYGALMSSWPEVSTAPQGGEVEPETAISKVVDESLVDDLRERQLRESPADDVGPRSAVPEPQPDAVASPPNPESLPPSAAESSNRVSSSEPSPCIRLGSVRPVNTAGLWCPPNLSNGHLIIIGGSGAGKTTALRHISGEIASRGVPVLVLDFHGDIDVPGGNQQLYSFDYSGNQAFINPFHLDARFGTRLTPSRLKWEFLEAWNSVYPTMGIHQTNFLAAIIEEAFVRAGITDNPATWSQQVTFADVLAAFENSEAPDSTRSRIESYMKRFLEWRIFHGGEAISVESFLTTSTRLDLSQLDESARNILADVVLRRLFLLVRALGPLDPTADGWAKFRVYVVIDEAQILMASRSDAKASLAKYAAEARKFGVGLILATQLRDNVPSDIWGNIDTRLFMQALDQGERSRNAKAANVPEAMLKSLARGEAILTSSSQPNAVPLVLKIEPSWMVPK